MSEPLLRFNPRPQLQVVPFSRAMQCVVVDDALLEPERVREFAMAHRARFESAPSNAYPGIELPLSVGDTAPLAEFFRQHLRVHLPVRRLLEARSRLALVTLAPEQLLPRQWICHRDRPKLDPANAIGASVLYLFEDEALGGTDFYAPRRPEGEIARLVHDSSVLDADAFAQRHGLPRGYPAGSNDWFERLGGVPARWNRLVVYDGRMFHSGAIPHPERLSADPRTGRLTLNGFFDASRPAT